MIPGLVLAGRWDQRREAAQERDRREHQLGLAGDHNLANREIGDVGELDRVLGDLRARVVIELAAGAKVRLV